MAKLWAIIKREYLERVRSKWFLIATFLGVVTFPVNPMLYALRRTGAPLVGSALGVGVFLLALYPLCAWMGLVGAGVAFLLGSIVSVIWRVQALRRQYFLVRAS